MYSHPVTTSSFTLLLNGSDAEVRVGCYGGSVGKVASTGDQRFRVTFPPLPAVGCPGVDLAFRARELVGRLEAEIRNEELVYRENEQVVLVLKPQVRSRWMSNYALKGPQGSTLVVNDSAQARVQTSCGSADADIAFDSLDSPKYGRWNYNGRCKSSVRRIVASLPKSITFATRIRPGKGWRMESRSSPLPGTAWRLLSADGLAPDVLTFGIDGLVKTESPPCSFSFADVSGALQVAPLTACKFEFLYPWYAIDNSRLVVGGGSDRTWTYQRA